MQPKDLMIYSDMDGTLLSSWDKGPMISPKNEDAIRMFIHEDGLFSIATGRNLKNGPTYLLNYDIKLPMVLVNGALIYDQSKALILRKIVMDKSFILEALNYFSHSHKVAIVISDINEVYHVIHPTILDANLPPLDFETVSIKIEDIASLEVLKVTFVTYPEDRDQIQEDISKFKTSSKISISPSSKRFIEIVGAGINKAEAINYVRRHILHSNRKLICIGDYSNDIEMLDNADIAAVPENGLESLKKQGRLMTAHHDQDAIADLIDQLLRIQ